MTEQNITSAWNRINTLAQEMLAESAKKEEARALEQNGPNKAKPSDPAAERAKQQADEAWAITTEKISHLSA